MAHRDERDRFTAIAHPIAETKRQTRRVIRNFYIGLGVVLAIAFIVFALAPAHGQTPGDCPQFFVGGQPPAILTPHAEQITLCFHGYALDHDGQWREPIWSAEHLTGAAAKAAEGVPRVNRFHPEQRLPPDQRSELADYKGDAYDRGHATPVGDFPVQSDRDDTFSMANMHPQIPALNRRIWMRIESGVRAEAERSGDVWIVTGPVIPASPKELNGRVAIPTYSWKAIYIPTTGVVGAYLAPNDASETCTSISLDDLEALIGVDPFPALTPAQHAERDTLPTPVHPSQDNG